MRKLLQILFCLFSLVSVAQTDTTTTFVTTQGKVHFFSATPLENIEATTTKAICVLNIANQKINTKIPISTFVFKDKLMQEHFNENYLESDKYPYSIFNGEIVEKIDFTKDGELPITVRGTFEIHGVQKTREVKGTLTIKNGKPVNAIVKFDVALVDHKIKIPKAVVMTIAEVIAVDLNFEFIPYQKKQ